MSMATITLAAEQLTAAAQAYHGKIQQIDAQLNAKKAEVTQFVDTYRNKFAAPAHLQYNPSTIYSKNGLNIAPDAAAAHRSNWQLIIDQASSQIFGEGENYFAALKLGRSFSYPPGELEQPVKYAADRSRTMMEFVLASNTLTTAQINAELAEKALLPVRVGFWSYEATSRIIPILRPQNAGFGLCLFVRFVNRAYTEPPEVPDDAQPQPIGAFGGDSSFTIHSIEVFQK